MLQLFEVKFYSNICNKSFFIAMVSRFFLISGKLLTRYQYPLEYNQLNYFSIMEKRCNYLLMFVAYLFELFAMLKRIYISVEGCFMDLFSSAALIDRLVWIQPAVGFWLMWVLKCWSPWLFCWFIWFIFMSTAWNANDIWKEVLSSGIYWLGYHEGLCRFVGGFLQDF